MQTTIADKISQLRKARSLTQEQLGAKLGISGQAVSKWENSESLPDILILPALCEILGITLDSLLEVPVSVKHKNIKADFCSYAREKGVSKTLIDLLSRLFNDSGKPQAGSCVYISKDDMRIYDENGMGFVIDNLDFIDDCLNQENEDIAFHLRILTDENCLNILKLISLDRAITRYEIAEKIDLDEATINRILLGFAKRKMVCFDVDSDGKRGYMFDSGISGLLLILAGCKTLNNGGAMQGFQWFSRK